MKIINIALKDLKILLKDKRAMSLIILMPIVLIVVLGFSLNSLFEHDKAKIQKTKISLVDYDKTKESLKVKEFLEQKKIKEYIELVDLDEDRSRKKVKDGDISALIVIEKGYEEAFKRTDKKGQIVLYKDEASPVETSIVESIIKKYSEINTSILLAATASEKEFKKYNLDSRMILQSIADVVDEEKDIVKDVGINSEAKGLSAMQYYSAAMVSMYILFVGMVGSSLIVEEREENTLKRLLTTECNRKTIICGKILGLFLLGIADVSILILFTRFIYGVSWGTSLGGICLLSVCMTFAASGLAILIATIFKRAKTIDMVNPVIILVISFIGGNMIPLYEMSDLLRKVSLFLLNNWSLRGYLTLMTNGDVASIAMHCFILIGMGIVFLTAGISRLKIE